MPHQLCSVCVLPAVGGGRAPIIAVASPDISGQPTSELLSDSVYFWQLLDSVYFWQLLDFEIFRLCPDLPGSTQDGLTWVNLTQLEDHRLNPATLRIQKFGVDGPGFPIQFGVACLCRTLTCLWAAVLPVCRPGKSVSVSDQVTGA